MRRPVLAATLVLTLASAAPAPAKVVRAEGILPPGQSGFVSVAGLASGTGSPHLYDQQPLFIDFKRKPFTFGQPGVRQDPRPGVTIVRDKFGVPSVTAGSEADVWWGAGYAIAEDRLFELELFRRATTGRLAEILGKDYLDDDLIARRDYYTAAERDAMFARLPDRFKQRAEAYRDGINAYISEVAMSPGKLPGEFPATGSEPVRWTVNDIMAVGIFLARTVPSGDGRELENLRGLKESSARTLTELLPLRHARQVTTIPARNGRFPQGRVPSRKEAASALRRSLALAARLPLPDEKDMGTIAAKRAVSPGLIGRTGGSYMFAARKKGGGAVLFNGPQLGFAVPELFVEVELHAPGFDIRGVTAPGVPVIGIGHNGNVAWGFTSGLSDEDDLYAEELVAGQPEQYRFRGETREMECRTEVFTFRSPPSGLLSQDVPEAGEKRERICRTLHGPVQARADGTAYARRYAIWNREIETLEGIAMLNEAKNIQDVDAAMQRVTWNENVMAADSAGNIGYWHPGLFQLRPRGWDERLPYPGTGEAEWPGLLDRRKTPSVINPKQGWLSNWNNMPSTGWTNGDSEATERLTAQYHRNAWLARLVGRMYRKGASFAGAENVVFKAGTVAQQRPLMLTRLRKAAKGAKGGAATVLRSILAWDGSYDRTDSAGKTDPGLTAWEALKREATDRALGPLGKGARRFGVTTSSGHVFDMQNGASYAFRTLGSSGLRRAAADAFKALEQKHGSGEPTAWREPRRMYKVTAQGAGSAPPLPFYDRGTWEQIVELSP